MMFLATLLGGRDQCTTPEIQLQKVHARAILIRRRKHRFEGIMAGKIGLGLFAIIWIGGWSAGTLFFDYQLVTGAIQ